MTEGFGEADVFSLPYKILYEESKGNKTIINQLRKKWWFNYVGKKISLISQDPFLFIKPAIHSKKELNRIRNKTFCDTIWKERKKFEGTFDYLKKIEIKKIPYIDNSE